MSFVFSVNVKYHNPYIVVGYKDPKNLILQLFNVSANQWLIQKFQPNFNGQILNHPKNQSVAVDSRFFWYDAVKQRVVGYNLFSGECYLAEAHTHDHGAGDSKPCLAFISGGDDGSLNFCLQWLSPTKINGSPMVKFHCLVHLSWLGIAIVNKSLNFHHHHHLLKPGGAQSLQRHGHVYVPQPRNIHQKRGYILRPFVFQHHTKRT